MLASYMNNTDISQYLLNEIMRRKLQKMAVLPYGEREMSGTIFNYVWDYGVPYEECLAPVCAIFDLWDDSVPYKECLAISGYVSDDSVP